MTKEPEIILDGNGLRHLRDWLDAKEAKRILLLTGPSKRYADRVIPILEGLQVEIFSGAKVHVPRAVVVEGETRLQAMGADTVISLGGGAATGLGKALRLNAKVVFVAIPTTYAGSEMTTIYGITDGNVKQTGRDENVRPDLVIYDPEFTTQMPKRLTTTSLLNALAHPISALSTDSLSINVGEDALCSINTICRALERLADSPSDRTARTWALEGMSLAGRVLNDAEVGIHHKLAHLIGGCFKVDHGGLHSVLLPYFVRSLFETDKPLYEKVSRAAGSPDLPASLFDFLRRAGAATSLKQLGVSASELERVLSKHPELTVSWVSDALLGTNPSIYVERTE